MFRKKLFITFAAFIVVLLFFIPAKSQAPTGLADTPWSMYQHDPQHTGRSAYLGPVQQPQLLWTAQFPYCMGGGGTGGISIAKDGNLVLSLEGCLLNFDPITRKLMWSFAGGTSQGTPLISNDGNIYWGFNWNFIELSTTGRINWEVGLPPVISAFASSPTFGIDNNLYFVRWGLWSFTKEGNYRWYIPYGNPAFGSHGSPAVGFDGTIYASGMGYDLCAYSPDSTVKWCLNMPEYYVDETPSIGMDGTIYIHPEDGCGLMAVNPSGFVEWSFIPDELYCYSGGSVITTDGSLYFALHTNTPTENYLYAVDMNGKFKWKVYYPKNPLTGLSTPIFPITVDRAGNSYTCLTNSRCYGIGSDGTVLWEYEFPLVDSIIVTAGVQPIIAADGLLYVVDYQHRLYAFADPTLYPALTTPRSSISFQVEPGTLSFTTTVPISSTVFPITYTASITPSVEWLSVAPSGSMTPDDLSLLIDPATLPPGIYQTYLRIMPSHQAGSWLEIPVNLSVGVNRVFLPVTSRNYKQPYRIFFISKWFTENQLASIEQTGYGRNAITRDLPGQLDWVIYAPDGRKVATVPYLDQKHQINVLDTVTGSIILEIVDQGENKYPAWSPESDRIAFVSMRDDPTYGEVYVINLDGTGLTRLTDNQVDESNLVWSPNGQKIAMQVKYNQVFIMNSDGSDFHRLATSNWSDIPEGWSPDGRYLLLRSLRTYSTDFVCLGIYDLQTGTYTYLTDHYHSGAQWSPDGTLITYSGWDDQSRYDWDILVIHPDGSGEIKLTHALDKLDSQPVWSPDSQWIAFASREQSTGDNPNYDIYVIRPDGTDLMQLTTNIQGDANPFWQPVP